MPVEWGDAEPELEGRKEGGRERRNVRPFCWETCKAAYPFSLRISSFPSFLSLL